MTEEKIIRVMIVDDHAVVRSGLTAFLLSSSDFQLVGEARNGEQAVRLCQQTQPDVVLMDLMMPGMDGPKATLQIRTLCPQTQVIALTSFKDRELVQAAIQAGAIGYLLKDVSAEELAAAIRSACAGRPTLAPEAAEVLMQDARGGEFVLGSDLTHREREVLGLLVEGLNNQQIAAHLVLSVATIKSHVSSILSKLGVATRTEAVALALKNKIQG